MSANPKKQKAFSALRGMKDYYGDDVRLWDKILATGRAVAQFYGFEHIEFPHLEDPGVFVTGLGKGSDLGKKQLYILKNKEGDSIALRPDASSTARPGRKPVSPRRRDSSQSCRRRPHSRHATP